MSISGPSQPRPIAIELNRKTRRSSQTEMLHLNSTVFIHLDCCQQHAVNTQSALPHRRPHSHPQHQHRPYTFSCIHMVCRCSSLLETTEAILHLYLLPRGLSFCEAQSDRLVCCHGSTIDCSSTNKKREAIAVLVSRS
jgi:hypothetical protein